MAQSRAMFSKPKNGIIYSVIRGLLNLEEVPGWGSVCEGHTEKISVLMDIRF